eukprot:27978-Rhodomonas_salina.1
MHRLVSRRANERASPPHTFFGCLCPQRESRSTVCSVTLAFECGRDASASSLIRTSTHGACGDICA